VNLISFSPEFPPQLRSIGATRNLRCSRSFTLDSSLLEDSSPRPIFHRKFFFLRSSSIQAPCGLHAAAEPASHAAEEPLSEPFPALCSPPILASPISYSLFLLFVEKSTSCSHPEIVALRFQCPSEDLARMSFFLPLLLTDPPSARAFSPLPCVA